MFRLLKMRGKKEKVSSESEPNKKFPTGLRVLAVDDDNTSLSIMESMLKQCEYTGLFVVSLKYSCVFTTGFLFLSV